VDRPGAVCLPGRFLSSLAKAMPQSEIEFHADEARGRVIVSCGRFEAKLFGEDPSSFPAFPSQGDGEMENDEMEVADSLRLVGSLEKTMDSVVRDDDNYNLAGIFVMREEPGALTLVSTDSQRINVAMRTLPGLPGLGPEGAIIPLAAAKALAKVAAKSLNTGLLVKDGRLFARAGGATLCVRLLEGPFPDYRALAPAPGEGDSVAKVERRLLLEAIKRVRMGNSPVGKLELGGGALVVSAMSPEAGGSREALPADVSRAAKGWYNLGHLRDSLASMGSSKASMRICENGVLVLTGEFDDGYLGVVASLNDQEEAA
jgi:DNA polymerase III sliding clamp (beta) subunit (PCNA family)